MRKVALAIILILFVSGCSTTVVNHDVDKAINTTNMFLKNLIKEDYSAAYREQISDRMKSNMSFKDFETTLKQIKQSRGKIKKAVFESYMDVPGQRETQLFYTVYDGETGTVPYHFVLEGDSSAGYKINLVDIGDKVKYPPNMVYVGLKRIKIDKHIEVNGQQ